MAKRLKIIHAGRLGFAATCSVPLINDSAGARADKLKCSTEARERINLKCAWQKLELLIAANFATRDYHVVLTYDDAHLPRSRDEARRCIRRFLSALREHRRARGQDLRYIYNIEGLHDDGRYHHHLLINSAGLGWADTLDLLRSLWINGTHIYSERIDIYHYDDLAKYFTKEAREHGRGKVGERLWTSSQNLTRPKPITEWVSDMVTVSAPPGAIILSQSSDSNDHGSYAYIKYLMPEERGETHYIRPKAKKKE